MLKINRKSLLLFTLLLSLYPSVLLTNKDSNIGRVQALYAKSKKKGSDSKVKKAPSWLLTPSSSYPQELYFSAVGEGKSMETSQVNAIASIASIFNTSIDESVKTNSSMEKLAESGKVSFNTSSSISQSVLKKVSVEDLIGVEIKDSYIDENGKYYSLAVMNKKDSFTLYSNLISEAGSAFNTLSSKVNKEDTYNYYSFSTYSLYLYLENLAQKISLYYARAQVLDIDNSTNLKKYLIDSKIIKASLNEISANLPIRVTVNNDVDKRIFSAFSKALTQKGFKTGEDAVRYSLVVDVQFNESPTKDGKTYHSKYALTALLQDENNSTLFPYSFSGRAAMSDKDAARLKAIESIEKKIASDYDTLFTKYLLDAIKL